MEPVTLGTVCLAQRVLYAADVASVVTGDVGMSYHGVDIAIHDIELCVLADQRARAIATLRAHTALYQELPMITDPDFYHPYKKGAARFRILNADEPFELHIVTDDMLGLHLIPSATETGLSRSTANSEILDLCGEVSDVMLQSIIWPTLGAFTTGWLHLADVFGDLEHSLVYLMQAERLIDANDVDDTWCQNTFTSLSSLNQARELLSGKRHRQIMSDWS